MKIFKNANITKKYKRSVIAIGNFDGVHKGHQKVFEKAKKFSKKKKLKFGVLTFSPLPIMFFNKKIKNYKLTLEDQKFKLFKKFGVNFVVNINFNKNFSKISAENFIKKILFKKINPNLIFVSNNFKFGNKRKGNVYLLKKFQKMYDYHLIKVNPYKRNNKIVSSSRVRKLLQQGNIKLANQLLGRNWFIDGVVKKGKKLGRKLGFRTCNINLKNYILPKVGIYLVKVLIANKNKIFDGVSYIGSRPTFNGKEIFLETNIFNISKNLYKKKLRIYFVRFMRNDRKFRNSGALVKQMNKDVIFAKKGLKAKLML